MENFFGIFENRFNVFFYHHCSWVRMYVLWAYLPLNIIIAISIITALSITFVVCFFSSIFWWLWISNSISTTPYRWYGYCYRVTILSIIKNHKIIFIVWLMHHLLLLFLLQFKYHIIIEGNKKLNTGPEACL